MTTIRILATAMTALALRGRDDNGQATAEYALVLLGVAAIALAVVSWATRTNLVGKLLDAVFSGLLRKVT
jgi:Flp pilus assembly pilin Flp